MNKLRIFLAATALSLLVAVGVDASLSSFWQERGESFIPCNQERVELAAEFAVWNYDCSAEKNNLLEARLRDFHKSDDLIGYSVVSRYRTTLGSSMTSNQTTVPASSVTTFDGHVLTMADLGSVVFLTLEPGSSREEIVKCTGISGTSWTGCTRGLAFYGTTETAVSANQKAHNAGSVIVMSNVHYVYEQFVDTDTSSTINAQISYTVFPEMSPSSLTPTTSGQFVTKLYADNLASSGVATSTEATSGKSRLSTQAQMAASTDLGINDPLVLQAKYSTSSCQVAGNYSVVTDTDGKINQNCLDLTETFAFTGNNTHSGQETFTDTVTMATTTMDALEVTSSTITNLTVGGEDINQTVDGSDVPASIHTHSTLNSFASSSASEFTYANSTVETDFVNYTIAANTLGTRGFYIVDIPITDFDIDNNGVACETFTTRVHYGSTVMGTIAMNNSAGALTDLTGYIRVKLVADGSASAQRGTIEMFVQERPGLIADNFTGYTMARASGTENSTTALDLRVTGDWNNATGVCTITTNNTTIEKHLQ